VHSAGNAAWLRAAHVPEAKLHIIPNWVDLEPYAAATRGIANRFRRQLELGEKFVVLFAGVMGYAQDMETIVEAAAGLRDEPRIVFLLVGDGSERPGVERRVGALGLENVRLLPFVSREDYPRWWRRRTLDWLR
jgi:colanic acid biosynthesis glycosyl transferase WcaI